MAKKLGKFLLFTAAVGSAAVAAYYFLQKKDSVNPVSEDDDYDDFSEDPDSDSKEKHNYVSLTPESRGTETVEEQKEDGFTPLTETVSQAAENAEETVEEFFDEEDPSDMEPPLHNS